MPLFVKSVKAAVKAEVKNPSRIVLTQSDSLCITGAMKTFTEVGTELVAASKEIECSPGEILQEIFPFVFEASRRMSARQISTWLKENRGIEISQPTISRALRNPRKYWEAFADSIEPHARIVENALDWPMEKFLYNQKGFEHATVEQKERPKVSGDTEEEMLASLDEYRSAVGFLRDNWFSLDNSVRDSCYPFFQPEKEEESEH
jgi:hypothetical protein